MGSDLFAGTYQFGVYRSTDNGNLWEPFGLNGLTIDALGLNGAQLFAGNEGPLQRRRVPPAEMACRCKCTRDQLPECFTLDQNYPNPFNPVTTIRFSLPETRQVTLVIYDISGSEVARLVDGQLEQGAHRITWDASGFASGTYLYKLSAGGDSEVRKLLLIR